MKIRALLMLLLSIGFFLISFIVSDRASAQATSTVPQIELQGLNPHRGRNLTVIYGLGYRAAISTSDDQLTLHEVKLKRTFHIDGNSVVIPPADLPRSGIFLAYNVIVFVVHNEPTFAWQNLNNSTPDGETAGPLVHPVAIDSLTKSEVDTLTQQGGGSNSLRFDFGAKVLGGTLREIH